ncbi:MAG: cytochrome d ubiquinol oxidase subunit II [Prosthecobacter sp.]|uniref:cytochrome d ubiquinol oxidase subunit II n=1 Tax=Prosthecobacter sp. TaxID=1965333 RepID=UPI0025EAF2CF|nr:cytochrome d ubiquinol oxidase subunit II [Prosthecobacter sp.]MCF7785232.1 cytochrome d ubiquinol oxidase subunit II [Prosthecobacter sp.]
MYELIIAAFVLLSLILYALLGGADFGGGMWDLLACGPRAEQQRKAIAAAISPIWEANHVWLILVIVLLFSAFPPAFAALMTALHIPITLMLTGIVLRGSAFIFRKYDSQGVGVRHRWGAVFGAACFFTPFFQGMVMGALTTGQIRCVDGQVTTGFFAGWLTPFAFACGVFAPVLFTFLAATYMTLYTRAEPALQNDFRRRALGSGLALGPVALAVFLTSKTGAPEMFHGLTQWWAPLLLTGTSLCAGTALLALWRRWFVLARIAAAAQVALILAGWGCAQYPNLITPDVTLHNSAAPEATLRLLTFALSAGAVLLLPALIFLFRLFSHPDNDRDAPPKSEP